MGLVRRDVRRVFDREYGRVRSRDYQDLAGGLLVGVIGAFTVYHSASTLSMGTMRSMGPGMFPLAIGVLLMVFGVMIFIPALFRPGVMPRFRIWTPVFVFGAILVFGLMIVPFGLIPAVTALVLISAMAELKVRPISLAVLCGIVCLLAWLVYKVGMRVNVPLFRWPL